MEDDGDLTKNRLTSQGPRALVWLLTTRCNLSCRSCYVAHRFRDGGELGLEAARGIVEEALRGGLAYLGFTGGEVFLRPDLIFPLLEAARARGVETTIVTNGLLISEEVARRLAALGVGVYLSLDGARRETHERIRGEGTWEKVIAAAELLRSSGVRFSTVLTLSRINASEASSYVARARELGAEEACFVPMMPAGRARPELVLRPREVLEVLREIEEAAEALVFPVSLWCLPFAGLVTRSPLLEFFGCRDLEQMDIGPNGEVLLCDVLDIKLGSVRQGLAAGWEAQLESELARRLAEPELGFPCASCELKAACRGGCFARSLLLGGDIYAPDPFCPRVAGLS